MRKTLALLSVMLVILSAACANRTTASETTQPPPEPETEDKDDNEGDGSSGDGTVNSTGSVVSQGNAGTTGGSYSTGTQGRTTTTSFDILQVSKVFLDYTGDQERFYSKAFEYVHV